MIGTISIAVLLGFGLGLRIGLFGLILFTLILAGGIPAALVAVTGDTLGDVLPTAAAALAAFELATLTAMIVRHGTHAADPVGAKTTGRAPTSHPASNGALLR